MPSDQEAATCGIYHFGKLVNIYPLEDTAAIICIRSIPLVFYISEKWRPSYKGIHVWCLLKDYLIINQ